MDLGLQGKHAIVTGGSRGIGKAIARELAREGVDVAIVARTQADLEATARELAGATNRRILPLAADVTSKEQVERVVAQAAQQLGGLHILVNSGSHPGGSTTATGPIETVVDEDLIEDFNIKYVGALRCSRAVIPFMKRERWGRIINISGGNARNAGNLSGGARNAGLVHMTKTLSVQLGRHGITVNCIHPGTTRTERTPSLLAARAAQLGVSPEQAERQQRHLGPGLEDQETGQHGRHHREQGQREPALHVARAAAESLPLFAAPWARDRESAERLGLLIVVCGARQDSIKERREVLRHHHCLTSASRTTRPIRVVRTIAIEPVH